MGMVDSIINYSFEREHWGILPASDPPGEIYKALQEIYASALDILDIVTGEGGSKLFRDPETIRIFNNLLDRGVNINFVFHKDDDYGKAIEKFKSDNKELWELKTKYSNFKIIWSSFRPLAHYHIVDKKLILEKPHQAGSPKNYVILDDPNLAEEWGNRFQKYLSSPDKATVIQA